MRADIYRYNIATREDGTEVAIPRSMGSPGSDLGPDEIEEQEDDEDDLKDIAILCEECYENGCWDTMRPGGGHDDRPVWGIAEVDTDDGGDWIVTWHATDLTVTEAEEHLDRMDFPGGWYRMS